MKHDSRNRAVLAEVAAADSIGIGIDSGTAAVHVARVAGAAAAETTGHVAGSSILKPFRLKQESEKRQYSQAFSPSQILSKAVTG
jgi:hypothetical protein